MAFSDNSLEDNFIQELTEDVRQGCEPFGVVEKIKIFDKNPDGVVVVKFKQPLAASNVHFIFFECV